MIPIGWSPETKTSMNVTPLGRSTGRLQLPRLQQLFFFSRPHSCFLNTSRTCCVISPISPTRTLHVCLGIYLQGWDCCMFAQLHYLCMRDRES